MPSPHAAGTPQTPGAPIPVHLTYFTAWVDDAGRTRFFGDVYRWDEAK